MLRKIFSSPWFISAVIAIVTLLIFWRVLVADFVMWDDDVAIYKNPIIQGLNFDHLFKVFTDVDSMMRYNPLTLLGWSITYHFCKLNPFWYHFVNWVLHGLSALLVFFVLRKLLMSGLKASNKTNVDQRRIDIAAGLSSLLWSVHPLRVEPVAWCTDRTYCQALFFLLLSLLFYLQASESDGSIKRKRLLTASVIFYIISLFSHAIGMSFFVVLLVLDIYLFRKLGGSNGWWKTSAARRTILEKIPFAVASFAVALITVCIRIASAGGWEKPVSLAEFGLLDRFMQAMYILGYYIWRPLFPFNLSPAQTTLVQFDPLSPLFIFSAFAVIILVILLFFLRRRWPLGAAIGICYFALLMPVLGIFEHPHYACDRYSLIVSILWSVLIAAWLANPNTKTLFRKSAIIASIVIIAGLGLLTFRQTRVWSNSVNLFEHIINVLGDDPYAYDPHSRLATYFFEKGQYSEAEVHLRKSDEIMKRFHIKPDFVFFYTSGFVYNNLERYPEAIEAFNQALKIKPHSAGAYVGLGNTLGKINRYSEAEQAFINAIKIKPNLAEAYCFLGSAYINQNRWKEAKEKLQRALELNPYYPQTYYNLAIVFLKTGDKNSAIKQYNVLEKSNPEMAGQLLPIINGKN